MDRNNEPVSLATELGRGGEGAVFEVAGRSDIVAKVYLSPLGTEHSAKLAAMLKVETASLVKLAAWPTDLVFDKGKTVGFLMPKVVGFRPAFELYGPKLRLQRFPKADWRFLVRAAANTARAFAAVHDAKQVIGDVNHGNLLIGMDATVRLIDCDSFQISEPGHTWFCEVGVPTHQPPEMQGLTSYSGVVRTTNHDAFGLAVLIFQMLCLARHPYSGQWKDAGDPPSIEDAIRQFYYAYATGQRSTPMRPPPQSLPIEALGQMIGSLFNDAFLRGGISPAGRPTAARWISALDELEHSLKPCTSSPGHRYLSVLHSCPWCILEGKSGVLLFPVAFAAGNTDVDGFMLLWQKAEATTLPSPRGKMPKPPTVRPSTKAKLAGRNRCLVFFASCVSTCAIVFAAIRWASSPVLEADFLCLAAVLLCVAILCNYFLLARSIRSTRATLRPRWLALQKEWNVKSGTEDADALKKKLLALKTLYDALLADRNAKLQALQKNRPASQLREYLDHFRIAGAGIKGVGDGKAAVLQSYGIETAADVVDQRLLQIPGFGPKTVANMVAWRDSHTRRFRFDPSKPVSVHELRVIENGFVMKRRSLETQLGSGLAELKNAIAAEAQVRFKLVARYREISPKYAQALADAKAALFLFEKS